MKFSKNNTENNMLYSNVYVKIKMQFIETTGNMSAFIVQ